MGEGSVLGGTSARLDAWAGLSNRYSLTAHRRCNGMRTAETDQAGPVALVTGSTARHDSFQAAHDAGNLYV